MFDRTRWRAGRTGIALAFLAATLLGFAGTASGDESLGDLQARMDDIQADLDALTARIEGLRTEQDHLEHEISETETRIQALSARHSRLQKDVVERANLLYRSGGTGMIEVLFSSASFTEMADRAEIMSQASLGDSRSFVSLARTTAELEALGEALDTKHAALDATEDALASESSRLQARFEEVAAEYRELKASLVPAAPAAPVAAQVIPRVSGSTACPVAGPVSFIDSWGAPRAGHTHQGVDMMAAYGTPIAAIVSGTITYAGYGGSAGYWQILSGDDGNSYWYMHNQTNIVTGGHVSAGQQIATVGDTGNAAGTPHLHFEYHPGGGAAVNPYPLVASIC